VDGVTSHIQQEVRTLERQEVRTPDARIAVLARRQHGVVSHVQLLRLGLGQRAIQYRLRIGRLHRVHRGVYAVGHSRLTLHGRWMAAVLAVGADAVLSHVDAAAHWGLRPVGSGDIHVTVPGRRPDPRAGVRLHRVRRLHPDDGGIKDGIPVTTVARTIFDSAEMLRPTQVERLCEEAERLRLFDLLALEAVCQRNPRRGAARILRELLATLKEPPPTRTELERLFIEFCRQYGIPEPACNVTVAGYEVDAWWPDTIWIVELDGYAYHSSRTAFENDRNRDLELKLAGFEVIRITHRLLTRKPELLAERLRRLLATGALTGA
jgi:REase_MTES_1575/Transcriptional regulator, AbiEi antitoxin